MKKQPTQATWDLSDLYHSQSDPKIETDLQLAQGFVLKLQTYKGKLNTLPPRKVKTLIVAWEGLGFLTYKLELFAHLTEATATDNPDVTRFTKQIEEKLVALSTQLLFIPVEFSKLPAKKWQELLTAPELTHYHHLLERLALEAKHTLTEPEEKILAEKSQTSWNALTHLYKITTSTLHFPWKGKEISLDELLVQLHDAKAATRKKAAFVLHQGLKANNKTTPPVYNALIQDKAISDKLRNYTYPEASRFESDEVDQATIKTMIQVVNANASVVKRYYTLKKKILNLDTLYWWDRFAPLPQTDRKISVDEAKTMVIDTYADFAPKLGDIVTTMFEKQHVDWFPGKSKQGGAFCAMSGKTIYPYVLMNYTETPNDVMTLAHELGHAIHDVLSQEKNPFFLTHPSLALAEIASTFGESLLFDRLIHSSLKKQDKITLLMAELESAIATIYRQVTMFQFEQAMHTTRREKGEVSREQIDALWHTITKKPSGDTLEYTPEHANTWMYIPHIINTPFYVYSYAFAQLCTFSLVQHYRTIGKEFVHSYLQILASGGTKTTRDTLQQAGLDITKPKFWRAGLEVVEGYLKELEALVA